MQGITPFFAFLLGAAIGGLSYGPFKRWLVGLRRASLDQKRRPQAQREDAQALLLMFATLHPAPWLLILGIPVALYQLVFGPLRWIWCCLVAGIAVAAALIALHERIMARGVRFATPSRR